MAQNPFISSIRTNAGGRYLRAALPDAEDVRVLQAATMLRDDRIAQPVLVGREAAIRALASDNHVDLRSIEIVDPQATPWHGEFARLLFEKRKAKGMTAEQAADTVKSPLYCAVIADSLSQAREWEQRIDQLPSVARVISLVKYLTEDQERKLALIHEIKQELGAIPLPELDSRPVNLTNLSRTLFSLQGYLGQAIDALQEKGSAQTRVEQLESLRNSVIRLRRLAAGGNGPNKPHVSTPDSLSARGAPTASSGNPIPRQYMIRIGQNRQFPSVRAWLRLPKNGYYSQ